MNFSPLIQNLIQALQCLPGVGPRSAQRMVFHLLEKNKAGAQTLASALQDAAVKIGRCESCRTFSENPMCDICNSPKRESHLLCIVEMPADVLAVEQTGLFKGLYFVLMGHLSPIDGIGPKELGLLGLKKRFAQAQISEVILATNPTIEGEATAYYIAEMTKEHGIKTTRLAHGVPIGGELEYLDAQTLARAVSDRSLI